MTEEKKRDVKLNHTRMKEGQFVRNLWVVTVEQGVTREDLTNPGFWAHVAFQLRPYDRLEVRSDDGIFFAEYLVLACERTYAKVKELSWISLTTKDVALSQDEADLEKFEYKFRGPHAKHSIIRKSDGAVMVEKLETQDQARQWLLDNKKTLEA